MSFSILFYLKKGKKDKHNTLPVYCRISTSSNDRVEYYTKIRVAEKSWLSPPKRLSNGSIQYIKGSAERIKAFNGTLNTIEAKIQQKYAELLKADEDITAHELKLALSNADQSDSITLLTMMAKHCEKSNKKATKDNIQNFTKITQRFLVEHYKLNDVTLTALCQKKFGGFGARFVDWGEQQNWSALYIRQVINTVKAAVNIAVEFRYIESNPIKYKVKLKNGEQKKRETLSFEEVEKLETLHLTTKALARSRDVFLFQVYTGLAHIDMRNLRKEHLNKGIDGRNWIFKNREKTNTLAKIPLVTKAQQLLDKYANHNLPKGRLLPVTDRSPYNKNLKLIMKLAGIEKVISSHSARHTFATLMRESGSDLNNLKQIIAHSNSSMTEHYAQLTPDTLVSEMVKLEKKLGS